MNRVCLIGIVASNRRRQMEEIEMAEREGVNNAPHLDEGGVEGAPEAGGEGPEEEEKGAVERAGSHKEGQEEDEQDPHPSHDADRRIQPPREPGSRHPRDVFKKLI